MGRVFFAGLQVTQASAQYCSHPKFHKLNCENTQWMSVSPWWWDLIQPFILPPPPFLNQGLKPTVSAPGCCPLALPLPSHPVGGYPELLGSSLAFLQQLKCTMFPPTMRLSMSCTLCPTWYPTSSPTLQVSGSWSPFRSQCKHHLLRAASPVP